MPALGPRTPSVHIILCLVKLHQDGKRAVSREAGSESPRSGTNMGSHRAGAACTLILLVGLAKHSASLSSVAHGYSSGSEVYLTMGLVASAREGVGKMRW